MKTEITFKQMNTSDAVKTKINQRMTKLARFKLPAMECHIVLSGERHLQKADIVVHAKNFRAHGSSSTSDVYASIEQAFQKVEKTVRRYHDRNVRGVRQAEKAA